MELPACSQPPQKDSHQSPDLADIIPDAVDAALCGSPVVADMERRHRASRGWGRRVIFHMGSLIIQPLPAVDPFSAVLYHDITLYISSLGCKHTLVRAVDIHGIISSITAEIERAQTACAGGPRKIRATHCIVTVVPMVSDVVHLSRIADRTSTKRRRMMSPLFEEDINAAPTWEHGAHVRVSIRLMCAPSARRAAPTEQIEDRDDAPKQRGISHVAASAIRRGGSILQRGRAQLSAALEMIRAPGARHASVSSDVAAFLAGSSVPGNLTNDSRAAAGRFSSAVVSYINKKRPTGRAGTAYVEIQACDQDSYAPYNTLCVWSCFEFVFASNEPAVKSPAHANGIDLVAMWSGIKGLESGYSPIIDTKKMALCAPCAGPIDPCV